MKPSLVDPSPSPDTTFTVIPYDNNNDTLVLRAGDQQSYGSPQARTVHNEPGPNSV